VKINLADPNPATRFWIDESDESQGWVDLRLVSSEEMAKIDTVTIKKRNEYRRGQRYEVEDTNTKMRNRLLWDAVIVDWGNILDENNKQIKCTTDNKEMVMMKSAKFAAFVGQRIETLTDETLATYEIQEKN